MKHKQKMILGLKLALLITCCAMVVRTVNNLGPARVWEATRTAHPGWLAACVFLLFARFAVWTVKWRAMLARRVNLKHSFIFRLILANGFINLVTPTAKIGGGLLRAMALRKRNHWRFSEGYGEVFADQLTHFLGKMILFGLLALLGLPLLTRLGYGTYAPFVAGACFLIVILWFVGRNKLWDLAIHEKAGGRINAWAARLARKRERAEDQHQLVARLLKPSLQPQASNGKVLTNDLLLSALSFGTFCWSNALVLKALGTETSVVTVALVVMLGYLAGTLLGVMGGIGVTELFLIELYTTAGIAGEVAAAAALLHRAIFYVFILTLGGYATWKETRNLGTKPEPMSAVSTHF